MDTTRTSGRIALTICIAIASMGANADRRIERVEDGSVLQRLAMGPDPGGKSGAGVTPETTRTDHPATSGPESTTERRTEPKAPADNRQNSQDAPRNDGGHSSAKGTSPSPSAKQ